MKIYKTFITALLFLFLAISCNSYKDAQQRQNLMMPKKSEIMRNRNKYQEPKKRKTYKPSKRAKSKKRR